MLPTKHFALRDCTASFKDRVASFEYGYYPGYWLYPYWPDLVSSGGAMIGYSTVPSVKRDKTYHGFCTTVVAVEEIWCVWKAGELVGEATSLAKYSILGICISTTTSPMELIILFQ